MGWVQTQAVQLKGCVTVGNLLDFSVIQPHYLQSEGVIPRSYSDKHLLSAI